MPTKNPNHQRLALIALLVVLFAASLYLALNRILQADECQNIYTARILASGWAPELPGGGALIYQGPLRWIAKWTTSSEALYLWARVLFLALFWINLGLCVRAAGIPLQDRRFFIGLLLVATLAPWWDHGFEVRHDNLLLGLILGMWILMRREAATAPPRIPNGMWIGLVCALAQGFAFKAFLYWVPLLGMLLIFPPAWEPRRSRLAFTLALGLGIGFFTTWEIFQLAGTASEAKSSVAWSITTSLVAKRFPPSDTLIRLTAQAPLLIGAVLASLASLSFARSTWRNRDAFWASHAPEGLFTLICFGALLANPTPFPYNLLHVIPAFAILALRWSMGSGSVLPTHPAPAVIMLVVIQGLTFIHPTSRHFSYTNHRQITLMALAEGMTDPNTDYVYDAMGMVASRKSHTSWWMLHSLSMRTYIANEQVGFASAALAKAPAVVIPNYRFTWLPDRDLSFINNHYIPLANDFLVLGGRIPEGIHSYQCLHPGRYLVSLKNGSNTNPSRQVKVQWNDTPITAPSIIKMTKGVHAVVVPKDHTLQVTWLGPHANEVPEIPPMEFETLFVNWY